MKNIYKEAIQKIREGSRFRIDLGHRSLRIDGKYVIKCGKFEGCLGIAQTDSASALSHIEELYDRYRHSIPSERDDTRSGLYFLALSESRLSDEDMLYGERRQEARIKLELAALCYVLSGSLVWEDFAQGKWFWQSPKHPSLIILKDWIENNN